MEDIFTITTAMPERKNIISDTIKAYSKKLLSFIRQRVAVDEDAEDILQDVLYQFAGNTEPIEQAGSWLFKVARNKITDNYRKQKLPLADDVFSAAGDDDEFIDWKEMILSSGDSPETAYLRNLFWEELQHALDELPAEQREVFIQNEIEGIPFRDIAVRTGIAVPTLISRKRYAVLHLRSRLLGLRNEILGEW